ncbi:LysR family transcriptional regulator [Gulosibacter sp. 10]|uniref:LysR family transcriptional regulator n=1 Tax=Gulosibacter sp. 10 TaxID=1255570 RepID=UPI00097F072B|nr:LysR substrate-binding domain-containing protein [Gulosibacter sp. 10]SJM67748.1 transcriptional regulator, LysR family [Gulosibacter sp. 10]
MELRHLEYFLAVAQELHFGRAAQRLRVSQPPLTVAIRQLEQELGVALFERTTRRVSLTPEGEAFRSRAAEVLEDLDAAVAEVAEVSAGTRGRLRIGYVSSASYSVLPNALRAFSARFPAVRLDIQPLTSGEQVDALLEGDLDIGFLRDPGGVPGVRLSRVSEEELIAVLPSEHPLAQRDEVSPGDLIGEPLVLFPYRRMPGYVSRLMEVFEGLAHPPRVVQQAIHQETVMGLVAAGVGVSLVPESIRRIQMPGVVTRPIEGRPVSELFVVHGERPGAAVRAFVECSREALRDE